MASNPHPPRHQICHLALRFSTPRHHFLTLCIMRFLFSPCSVQHLLQLGCKMSLATRKLQTPRIYCSKFQTSRKRSKTVSDDRLAEQPSQECLDPRCRLPASNREQSQVLCWREQVVIRSSLLVNNWSISPVGRVRYVG
jgi:hypothetical protein